IARSATHLFEDFLPARVTLSDPRDTTQYEFAIEQLCQRRTNGVRTPYRVGDTMTVLELPSTTRSTGSWTQVCASEHSVTSRAVHDVLGSAPRDVRVFDESRPSGARTLVPGRRVSSGLAA